MAFSGAVKIGDLNDFIAPSQACVVSLQPAKPSLATPKGPAPPQVAAESVAAVAPVDGGLQLNARPAKRAAAPAGASSGPETPAPAKKGFQQTIVDHETSAVKVSLADCLACSGCVTSAETVLLQAQSLKEFVARCEDPDAVVVVSVSPQSRASLAALHGISPEQVQARLANFLKAQLSVALVIDLGLGASLALAEAAAEFIARYRQARRSPAGAPGSGDDGSSDGPGVLPLLASACPGWVCYAEKTHGAYILPHIAAVRSPQAVMGALVKQVLARARGWAPGAVYHVSVMPCFDKKLEASREDFNVPGSGVAEVDASLTTGELQELLDKHGWGDLAARPGGRADNLQQLLLAAAPPAPEQLPQPQPRLPEPLMHAQPGSSGGYAEHIFAAAARALFGAELAQPAAAAAAGPGSGQQPQPQPGLPWKALRNADLQELALAGPDGRPLLRFARAYGFRNIQTLMHKIKTGRCEYDYVEVMACPSGCLNGGGQLKPRPGQAGPALLDELERLFYAQQAGQAASSGGSEPAGPQQQQAQLEQQQQHQGQQQEQPWSAAPGVVQLASQLPAGLPELQPQQLLAAVTPAAASESALAAVYSRVLGGGPGSQAAARLLHTGYHRREKTVASSLADW